MKQIILLIFILPALGLRAQKNIADEISALLKAGKEFRTYNLFADAGNSYDQKLGGGYKKLSLLSSSLDAFIAARPSRFEITIPGTGKGFRLQFIRSYVTDEHILFVTKSKGKSDTIYHDPPLCYHGIIAGVTEKTFVTASISNKTGVHVFISAGRHNIQVSQLNKLSSPGDYGLFENLPGNNESFPFTCGTKEQTAGNRMLPGEGSTVLSPQSYTAKVVRCYFECSFSYYQQNASSTETTFDRIATLFNQAALCYANEGINLSISQIGIWTMPDPFDHSNRDNGLQSFKDNLQDAYYGDLAMLCDWTPTFNSGLANGIGVLCNTYSNTYGPYIYNDLNYNNDYSNFPVAADAPDVYLIIHEIGHIVGSPHTHWCGWAGGAIDNCAAVEGSCNPGPTPVSGTMMSYCCTNSAIGIDFNNGFGPQPGNAIRNHINGSSCIGNGTSTCDVTLNLHNNITNTDYTKFEVSNTITADCELNNSANVLLDAGNRVRLAPGFKAPLGSSLRIENDGCGGNFRPIYRQGISQ